MEWMLHQMQQLLMTSLEMVHGSVYYVAVRAKNALTGTGTNTVDVIFCCWRNEK
jgi:hypothetical protein